MINKQDLFPRIENPDAPASIVKEVLNCIKLSSFPDEVGNLINRNEFSEDYLGCRFPENLDESELYNDYGGIPFEGVECWVMDEEVIVSEEEFFKVLKEACERYIELHPEKKDGLEKIMSQSTLL
jgi:hypothetical protein